MSRFPSIDVPPMPDLASSRFGIPGGGGDLMSISSRGRGYEQGPEISIGGGEGIVSLLGMLQQQKNYEREFQHRRSMDVTNAMWTAFQNDIQTKLLLYNATAAEAHRKLAESTSAYNSLMTLAHQELAEAGKPEAQFQDLLNNIATLNSKQVTGVVGYRTGMDILRQILQSKLLNKEDRAGRMRLYAEGQMFQHAITRAFNSMALDDSSDPISYHRRVVEKSLGGGITPRAGLDTLAGEPEDILETVAGGGSMQSLGANKNVGIPVKTGALNSAAVEATAWAIIDGTTNGIPEGLIDAGKQRLAGLRDHFDEVRRDSKEGFTKISKGGAGAFSAEAALADLRTRQGTEAAFRSPEYREKFKVDLSKGGFGRTTDQVNRDLRSIIASGGLTSGVLAGVDPVASGYTEADVTAYKAYLTSTLLSSALNGVLGTESALGQDFGFSLTPGVGEQDPMKEIKEGSASLLSSWAKNYFRKTSSSASKIAANASALPGMDEHNAIIGVEQLFADPKKSKALMDMIGSGIPEEIAIARVSTATKLFETIREMPDDYRRNVSAKMFAATEPGMFALGKALTEPEMSAYVEPATSLMYEPDIEEQRTKGKTLLGNMVVQDYLKRKDATISEGPLFARVSTMSADPSADKVAAMAWKAFWESPVKFRAEGPQVAIKDKIRRLVEGEQARVEQRMIEAQNALKGLPSPKEIFTPAGIDYDEIRKTFPAEHAGMFDAVARPLRASADNMLKQLGDLAPPVTSGIQIGPSGLHGATYEQQPASPAGTTGTQPQLPTGQQPSRNTTENETNPMSLRGGPTNATTSR